MSNFPIDGPMPNNFNDKLGEVFNSFEKSDSVPEKKSAIQLRRVHELEENWEQFNKPPSSQELVQLYKDISIKHQHKVVDILRQLIKSKLSELGLEIFDVLELELGRDLSGLESSIISDFISEIAARVKEPVNQSKYLIKFIDILNSKSKQIQNEALLQKIEEVLRGINRMDQVLQDVEEADLLRSIQDKQLSGNQVQSVSDKQLTGDNVAIKSSIISKDGQSITNQSGTIRVNVVEPMLQHIISRIQLKDGFIQAFGTLFSLPKKYIAALIQISNIQPIFVISEVMAQLMVQMDRLSDEKNSYKVAIVTDYVAALREIDSVDYIIKVKPEDDLSSQKFYETYKQLYEDGFHYVISLHLNHNLRKTYRYAREAKTKILDQNFKGFEVEVHNTNANGVGLGLMIYELDQAIQQNFSPLELNSFAKQLVRNYKHWVCPLEYDFVKKHQWIMKLADAQNKVKMRLFHFIPVIELDKALTLITVSYTKKAALLTLVNTLDAYVAKENKKINRICIEYRGVYREAIRIRNQIKVRYPSIKVSLQSVGSLTVRVFGPELVGICII